MVPKSLHIWFYVHFAVDLIVGIPLFLFPEATAGFLNIEFIEPITARVVGAALLAIGGMSFVMNHRSLVEYILMLELKIIWSFFATIGLIISIMSPNSPTILYLFTTIFLLFFLLWNYYYLNLRKLRN